MKDQKAETKEAWVSRRAAEIMNEKGWTREWAMAWANHFADSMTWPAEVAQQGQEGKGKEMSTSEEQAQTAAREVAEEVAWADHDARYVGFQPAGKNAKDLASWARWLRMKAGCENLGLVWDRPLTRSGRRPPMGQFVEYQDRVADIMNGVAPKRMVSPKLAPKELLAWVQGWVSCYYDRDVWGLEAKARRLQQVFDAMAVAKAMKEHQAEQALTPDARLAKMAADAGADFSERTRKARADLAQSLATVFSAICRRQVRCWDTYRVQGDEWRGTMRIYAEVEPFQPAEVELARDFPPTDAGAESPEAFIARLRDADAAVGRTIDNWERQHGKGRAWPFPRPADGIDPTLLHRWEDSDPSRPTMTEGEVRCPVDGQVHDALATVTFDPKVGPKGKVIFRLTCPRCGQEWLTGITSQQDSYPPKAGWPAILTLDGIGRYIRRHPYTDDAEGQRMGFALYRAVVTTGDANLMVAGLPWRGGDPMNGWMAMTIPPKAGWPVIMTWESLSAYSRRNEVRWPETHDQRTFVLTRAFMAQFGWTLSADGHVMTDGGRRDPFDGWMAWPAGPLSWVLRQDGVAATHHPWFDTTPREFYWKHRSLGCMECQAGKVIEQRPSWAGTLGVAIVAGDPDCPFCKDPFVAHIMNIDLDAENDRLAVWLKMSGGLFADGSTAAVLAPRDFGGFLKAIGWVLEPFADPPQSGPTPGILVAVPPVAPLEQNQALVKCPRCDDGFLTVHYDPGYPASRHEPADPGGPLDIVAATCPCFPIGDLDDGQAYDEIAKAPIIRDWVQDLYPDDLPADLEDQPGPTVPPVAGGASIQRVTLKRPVIVAALRPDGSTYTVQAKALLAFRRFEDAERLPPDELPKARKRPEVVAWSAMAVFSVDREGVRRHEVGTFRRPEFEVLDETGGDHNFRRKFWGFDNRFPLVIRVAFDNIDAATEEDLDLVELS